MQRKIVTLERRHGIRILIVWQPLSGQFRGDTRDAYISLFGPTALELSATAIILVHNHPSGDPTPSRADIQMTQSIVDVAKPLGIAVHDHIVVGKDGHASFRALRLI